MKIELEKEYIDKLKYVWEIKETHIKEDGSFEKVMKKMIDTLHENKSNGIVNRFHAEGNDEKSISYFTVDNEYCVKIKENANKKYEIIVLKNVKETKKEIDWKLIKKEPVFDNVFDAIFMAECIGHDLEKGKSGHEMNNKIFTEDIKEIKEDC